MYVLSSHSNGFGFWFTVDCSYMYYTCTYRVLIDSRASYYHHIQYLLLPVKLSIPVCASLVSSKHVCKKKNGVGK